MLPWTLASLINNTDIVMKGVHLYVVCEDGETQDRIKTALKKIDLPPGTITPKDDNGNPLIVFGKYGYRYDSYCMLDINYWAFRGIGKREEATITLPIGHVLRHNYGWAVADYSLHPANDILQKNTWVRMSDAVTPQTGGDSPAQRQRLANHLVDASERAQDGYTTLTEPSTVMTIKRSTRTSPPTFSMKPTRTGISTRLFSNTVPMKPISPNLWIGQWNGSISAPRHLSHSGC